MFLEMFTNTQKIIGEMHTKLLAVDDNPKEKQTKDLIKLHEISKQPINI